jgi:hypothetical protein
LRLRGADAGAPRSGTDLFCCAYNADGGHVLSAGWDGCLRLWEAAGGTEVASVPTGAKPLSCCGFSLGGEDGQVHFVAVDSLENAAMLVTATPKSTPKKGVLGRLLGQPRFVQIYHYTCPACRRPGQAASVPMAPFPCPARRRTLRVHVAALQLQER